jgi:hypothetical protein
MACEWRTFNGRIRGELIYSLLWMAVHSQAPFSLPNSCEPSLAIRRFRGRCLHRYTGLAAHKRPNVSSGIHGAHASLCLRLSSVDAIP